MVPVTIESQHIAHDDVALAVPRCGHDSLVILAPGTSSDAVELEYATRLDVHKGVVRLCVESDEEQIRAGQQAIVEAGQSLRLTNRGDAEVRILMCRCSPSAGEACPNRIGRW
jgi:mannose-6-phosphate isomerase-like protein (cupin superfamily)